jgi:uncharacterized protein with HEPN domain
MMHSRSPKLLEDVVRSCHYIAEDTSGATLETYLDQRQMRQAVERNLEIIGEALSRLRAVDPDMAAAITDVQRIIGLRNRLAHGYDDQIEDALVWRAVQESLPTLQGEVERLLPPFET